jgi:hypothetical protein
VAWSIAGCCKRVWACVEVSAWGIDGEDVDPVCSEIGHEEELSGGIKQSFMGMWSVFLTNVGPWGCHVEGLFLKRHRERRVGAWSQRQFVSCES